MDLQQIAKKQEEFNKQLKELDEAINEASAFLQQKATERERLIGALAMLNDINPPKETQTKEPQKQTK
tara:strand:+ start:47 stop:250 length:204 start_codon:yes stop_codon:yes gene_type:complete